MGVSWKRDYDPMEGAVTPILQLVRAMLPTPMVRIELGGGSVFVKCEYLLPSGSHKDRESLCVCEEALKAGFSRIGVASTGNSALSLALIGRGLGLEVHIWVRDSTPTDRIDLLNSTDAVVHLVPGTYAECIVISAEQMALKSIFNANPGSTRRRFQGGHQIAREIVETLTPASIFVPTNNGTLLAGIMEGLAAVHAKVTVIAVTARTSRLAYSIVPFSRCDWAHVQSLCRVPLTDVDDSQIVDAMRLLARMGFFVEPASAAALAAWLSTSDNPGPSVVLLTGCSLRMPGVLVQTLGRKATE